MLRVHRVLIGAGSFYILNLFADDLYTIWWWFDILTPLNDEVKKEIEDKVLDAYEKESA